MGDVAGTINMDGLPDTINVDGLTVTASGTESNESSDSTTTIAAAAAVGGAILLLLGLLWLFGWRYGRLPTQNRCVICGRRPHGKNGRDYEYVESESGSWGKRKVICTTSKSGVNHKSCTTRQLEGNISVEYDWFTKDGKLKDKNGYDSD